MSKIAGDELRLPDGASVAVRMYCQGFGDCFLIRGREGFVLIDCGLVLRAKDERDRMLEVVNSVRAATGGHLSLLIVTHEHYDHLCGFNHGADLWKEFRIDRLWLPWTEDPDDALADKLNKYKQQATASLQAAFAGMKPGLAADRTESILGLLPAYSVKTGTALQTVRDMARSQGAAISFKRPGQVDPVMDGVDAIVLGPPHDEAKIFDLEGDAGDTFQQMAGAVNQIIRASGASVAAAGADYEQQLRQALGLEAAPNPAPPFAVYFQFNGLDPRWEKLEFQYQASLASGPDAYDQHWSMSDPLDRELHRTRGPGERRTAFEKRRKRAEELASFHTTRTDRRYYATENEWRQIGGEQNAPIERLALQLDSFTNNVSLALAFRLKDGRVLLFPGDAQIGNWKSWDDQPYSVEGSILTLHDLLTRTVLYKVGHHASHNGTYVGAFNQLPDGVICLVPFEPVTVWKSIPDPNLLAALQKKGKVCVANNPQPGGGTFTLGPESPLTHRPKFVDVYL